jgi:hypothetical protein
MLEGSRHPRTKPQWCAALACAGIAALAAGLDTVSAEEADKAQSGAKPVEANAAAADAPPAMTLETFLDRLMMAESGGRDAVRNPRSTAVGPFQFIRDTFLYVVRRHFAEETASLSTMAVLGLRTDRAFARRAAEAYAKDNAAHLASEALPTSFTNLRLAYLTGPSGAVRVLRAPPQAKVSRLLSSAAISANPFLAHMTAEELIAKCARDIEVDSGNMAGIAASSPAARPGHPKIEIKCNLKLPSCRRWVALRSAQSDRNLARSQRRQAVHSAQK